MKGFIEVPDRKGRVVLIAVNAISHVAEYSGKKDVMSIWLVSPAESQVILTELTYTDIKSLIENAL